MPVLTQFQKNNLLRRKQSDITRLADQYNKSINMVADQYQSAFTDYTKNRNEAMAPYNAAVDQYKADYGVYETNLASYKKKLTDYTSLLEDIQKTPLETVNAPTRMVGRVGRQHQIDGKWYTDSNTNSLPDGYTIEGGQLYKKRDAGQFTEKAPTAPEAPTAPTIAAFDSTQFDQKKAALETDYKREVGERKAGRINAVSRSAARPMLKGA